MANKRFRSPERRTKADKKVDKAHDKRRRDQGERGKHEHHEVVVCSRPGKVSRVDEWGFKGWGSMVCW